MYIANTQNTSQYFALPALKILVSIFDFDTSCGVSMGWMVATLAYYLIYHKQFYINYLIQYLLLYKVIYFFLFCFWGAVWGWVSAVVSVFCFCFSFCVCLYVILCMLVCWVWVARVFCWGVSFSSWYLWDVSPLQGGFHHPKNIGTGKKRFDMIVYGGGYARHMMLVKLLVQF